MTSCFRGTTRIDGESPPTPVRSVSGAPGPFSPIKARAASSKAMGFCFLPSGSHHPGLALAEGWQKPPLSLLRRYYSEKSEESKAPKTFRCSRKALTFSLSKNPMLVVVDRNQRFAGLREKCCGIRVRGSAPITPAGGSASCTSTFLTLCHFFFRFR